MTVLAGLGLAAGLVLLLAPMLVMNWVRGYLQKDEFRGRMEQFLGMQVKGGVTLEPLRWSGDQVTTRSLTASTGNGWKAEVSALRLALDWNAFRDRRWKVIETGADSLALSFEGGARDLKAADSSRDEPGQDSGEQAPGKSSIPGWLKGYLPDRTEIDGIRFDSFALSYPGPWRLAGSRLRLGAWQQGESSILATVEEGILETPVKLPTQVHPMKFNLTRATARMSRDDLHLTHATLTWMGESEITASGHVRPRQKSWEISTHFAGVPLKEVVSDDWKLRLTGLVEGDLDIVGKAGAEPAVKGTARLKDAALTAVPLLGRLASYTNVERFKSLVLDIATTRVSGAGQSRKFEDIVIQSNGLLRVEGRLDIQGGRLDGQFMLGVTPETLTWIPGARQHVFTSSHPGAAAGMLWAPLRITGTIDRPEEDLTARLIGGAGKALLNAPAEAAGAVGEALLKPVLGDDLAKKPGEALKGATEMIKNPADAVKKASDAAEKGLDLLKGVGGGLLGK
jgi:hypothetical protein